MNRRATISTIILVLCLGLCASSSAAPIHGALPDPLHGFALNKACGTAVDSEGDIYVANAGAGKVEVFDPSGAHLASIADPNTPCSLAVDSKGNLYVSEQATGKVVKFAPTSYPFSGTPSYGAPSTVDASGNAKGISVDPKEDRLYVAEGSRISTYDASGQLGSDAVQRVLPLDATGGTYTLTFEGEETTPLPYKASHLEVQAALEALSTIGPNNVSVTEGESSPWEGRDHIIAFTGELAKKDLGAITADGSGLEGDGRVGVYYLTFGFSGHIGDGELTEVTAVGAYTYGSTALKHYLYAADSSTDEILVLSGETLQDLSPEVAIDGTETPAGSLDFGTQGAALGVDQLNGHLYVLDVAHSVVDEFTAAGDYFTQIANPSLANAGPSGIAIDRSEGTHDGEVYVSAGAAAAAKLLGFGPVTIPSQPPYVAPSRGQSAALSIAAKNTCGVAVDSQGDIYVSTGAAIKVYSPSHTLLTTITDTNLRTPCYLAVDTQGVVYTVDKGSATSDDEQVLRFTPNAYPLGSSPSYGAPLVVAAIFEPTGLAVNPINNHLLVVPSQRPELEEYDSAAHGSGLLNAHFGAGIVGSVTSDVSTAKNGDIYVLVGDIPNNLGIAILNPTGTELLGRIDGSGAPNATSDVLKNGTLAVDWSSKDAVVFNTNTPAVQEFERSGAFVTEFGPLANTIGRFDVAIDNSGGPNAGTAYVAVGNEVVAFGPLLYGEKPVVKTGVAKDISGGGATLQGTVNPRGVPLTGCKFEYLSEAEYLANGEGFTGATSVPCVPSLGEIGSGVTPVAVAAQISGLDPSGRYRYRLVATNQFEAQLGPSFGEAGLFGPPLLDVEAAQPIAYAEATARAAIDPSGISTTYRIEYGTTPAYGNLTPARTLAGGDGPVNVEIPFFSLAEGTEYHYHVIVENEAGTVEGPDQTLVTLSRASAQDCANAALRAENNSGLLADCRAYELVTPADTRGATPFGDAVPWLVDQKGPRAGESVLFNLEGAALPGTDGTGFIDGYRAVRGSAAWTTELVGASFEQAGGKQANPEGDSPDQVYGAWSMPGSTLPDSLPAGKYLRTPAGFEPLGQGSLGTDLLEARSHLISRGAQHVIFSTADGAEGPPVQLEPEAPASPVGAIYDRPLGGPTHVVSLPPAGASPTIAAEFASKTPEYQGANEAGTAVVFRLGSALYVRVGNAETLKVADDPAAYAGISADGGRVFYTTKASGAGDLWRFDRATQSSTEIAPGSIFVNVSADGSHAYFTATAVLDDAEAGTLGADNLYAWDGSSIRYVAELDPQDLETQGFPNSGSFVHLGQWASASVVGNAIVGIGNEPSRTTPDGSVLVFQSHASLTGYDAEGRSEVYRYDAGANGGAGELELHLLQAERHPAGRGLLARGLRKRSRLADRRQHPDDERHRRRPARLLCQRRPAVARGRQRRPRRL